jgi:hypothetical protein
MSATGSAAWEAAAATVRETHKIMMGILRFSINSIEK